MTSIVLEGPIAEVREREIRLLHDVSESLGQMANQMPRIEKRLQQNAADLQDMFFLVVVVGEFNSGKSSFVNALLGDEILPMGITPTTDAIELVRWSAQPAARFRLARSRNRARMAASQHGRAGRGDRRYARHRLGVSQA